MKAVAECRLWTGDRRGEIAQIAERLFGQARVQAALNYAQAFPDEIEAAIRDHQALNFTTLSRMLPQAQIFRVEATDAETESATGGQP